jgi:hypothetical protein
MASNLRVDQILPSTSTNVAIGTATGTVTLSGTTSGTFSGNLTGSVNSTGVTTVTTLRATSIVGVTTAGITTAYIGSVNDGPLSGARNRIINGDMKIFQRETATTIGASSVYALDRWLFAREAGTESARFTVTSESLTSSDTPFTSDGLRKTMKVDITTASGGISAAQSHYITQRIEGFNASDLVYGTSNAKTCTVSFWLKTDVKTGQMGVALYNGGNRYYVQNINATTSWTKYTLVFPGDTSGAIADDNTQQLTLVFTLSSGSNLQGSANSWAGNFRNSTSGQADFTDSTSNNIYLTGVQLEVGPTATPFERRSYGQELALCRRYYKKGLAVNGNSNSTFFWSYFGGSSAVMIMDIDMPSFRTGPNFSLLNNSNVQYYSYAGAWTNTTLSVSSLGYGGWPNILLYLYITSDGDGRGKLLRCTNATDVQWVADAEL